MPTDKAPRKKAGKVGSLGIILHLSAMNLRTGCKQEKEEKTISHLLPDLHLIPKAHPFPQQGWKPHTPPPGHRMAAR